MDNPQGCAAGGFMNCAVEHPLALYLFIPLLFAFVFVTVRYRLLRKLAAEKNVCCKAAVSVPRISVCFWTRTAFRFFSGAALILALSGISWGTVSVPVQKSGTAVSIVFDISYSMEAKDAPGGISRLQAASAYALDLLEKMNGTAVSVVLAKGDGAVSVPLTEDFHSVQTLIECLSPSLMTAGGSSLGSGIKAALSSFPRQSSSASFVWLFTDCEETDSLLQDALYECVKLGIPVAAVGFGSERESEVVAGDGVTRIKTALRYEQIEQIIASVNEKIVSARERDSIPAVQYIDASEMGSAAKLLNMLKASSGQNCVSYEIRSMQRHEFFIALSAVFFLASVFFGELDIAGGKKRFLSAVSAASAVFLFSGCAPEFSDGKNILEGKLCWIRQDYQNAIGNFLEAYESAQKRDDSLVQHYAVYGLGATYLMQGETESAASRFSQIYDAAPEPVQFASLYNMGIISHRNGDYKAAADFFKRALLIDGTSTDAKINLELSLRENSVQSRQTALEQDPVLESSGDATVQNELYSIIHEDEMQQWKSQQKNSKRTSGDY